MNLVNGEKWMGEEITYQKVPRESNNGGETTKKVVTEIIEIAESANKIINPHDVEAAKNDLSAIIKEKENEIANVLEGLSNCDLAASMMINESETYRGILSEAAYEIKLGVFDSLKAKADEVLEKSIIKHDQKQKAYNEEAKSRARSRSDTDVKYAGGFKE